MVLWFAGRCLLGGLMRSTTRDRRRVLGSFSDDVPLTDYTLAVIPVATATCSSTRPAMILRSPLWLGAAMATVLRVPSTPAVTRPTGAGPGTGAVFFVCTASSRAAPGRTTARTTQIGACTASSGVDLVVLTPPHPPPRSGCSKLLVPAPIEDYCFTASAKASSQS